MSKLFALFIFFSISFFSFYSSDSISKSFAAVPTATPTPDPSNDSFRIELDRNTVVYPCPPDYRCVEKGDKDLSVTVIVSNTEAKNNSLRYKYTISGGRVIGEGAEVSWDLTGAQPGTYTITAIITDESGKQNQTAIRQITVKENGIADCIECPILSVNTPTTPTQAGEIIIFAANVLGGNGETITYRWTISDGKIIEGQGTPNIKVATNSKMAGKTVTATIEIGGVCSECSTTATGSGEIAAKKDKDK